MIRHLYLAGPDVFLPHAKEHGERLKTLCKQYGFNGHFPLDNEISASDTADMAEKIRIANIELIERCDAVIANLSPFRGPEPDSGTVFEVGYALAKGKTVIGFSHDKRTLKARTQSMLALGDGECDREGMALEDFGLTHNLMFAFIVRAGSFEEALSLLKAQVHSNTSD